MQPRDPVETPVTGPASADIWQTARDRLATVLDGWIASECRAVVERRLAAATPVARAALLPSDEPRAALARTVLDGLHPSAVAALLSPLIEAERSLLLDLAGGADPMLREAALDALFGIVRDRTARERVRDGCETLLAPGLALLGAATGDDTAETTNPPSLTPSANEADFLAALRHDRTDRTLRILASHAGIAQHRVAEAVWMRDARSLLGLAWRAGYSMRAARLLQTQLAGIPPAATLGMTTGGAAPMGRGEVAWQLALLAAI